MAGTAWHNTPMIAYVTNHCVFICDSLPLCLVLFHRPSPSPRLPSPAFNERLKSLEVANNPLAHDAHRISRVFDEALWIVFHLQHDLGFGIRQSMKGHHAGIRCAVPAPPGDALIGDLLGDLGIPLFLLPPDVGFPV